MWRALQSALELARLRRGLRRLARERAAKTARLLLESPKPVDEAVLASRVQEIEHLETLEKAAVGSSSHAIGAAILATVICLVIVSLDHARLSSARITLSANAARFVVNAPAGPGKLTFPEPMLVTAGAGLASLSVPVANKAYDSPAGDIRFGSTSGRLAVSKIEFGQQAVTLAFQPAGGDLIEFGAEGAPLTLVLYAQDEEVPLTVEKSPDPLKILPDEALELRTGVKSALDISSPWSVTGIADVSLIFAEQTVTDFALGTQISSIHSGAMVIHEGGGPETNLGPELLLRLEKFSGRISVAQKDNRLSILVDGGAGDILVGPKGHERSLMPSLLAYWFNNARITFLISAFGAFWGVLWSIRNILFP